MSQVVNGRLEHLDDAELDRRITFHEADEILEIDLSNVHFADQREVNRLYDRLEERIEQSGEDLWFFLVNYSNARIDTDAWIAFARRGKSLNRAHSQGSVRFDVSEETRRQIERDANTERFDPNLFADRESAIAHLRDLPSKRIHKTHRKPHHTPDEFPPRITFLEDEQIMDVDFSNFTFHNSRDVDDFYDYIEDRIRETDRKWYFLVNLNNCRIYPEAWIEYARRGKRLNLAASLGSVRYAAGSETEAEIRLRAQSQGFRPNVRNTREEALQRIAEMKSEAAH